MAENIVLIELIEDDINFELSSSSSDDDYDAIINSSICLLKTEGRITIKNYEKVIEEYREDIFISHFRMSRAKVKEVAEKFTTSTIYQNLHKNSNTRASITAEKHILVFLWFAGHQTACFRDVADRFDLSLSSLHDVITRVMMFLSSIAKDIITFPSALRKVEIQNVYYNKTAFPNVIGSIDGSHIKIDKPTERSVDYCNRKDFHSIVLQGVCDHNLNFIDIFIGYPGSVHDARIFRNSTIYNELDVLCDGGYLLGDSAYPLLPKLLTPFRDNGHLTRAQKMFNSKLSSCRVSIEHAFGLLKQRFRQLYHVKLRGHERISHFIRACCVLHNLANKEDATIFNNEEQVNDIQPDHIIGQDVEVTGTDVRNEICRQLFLRNDNQRP